jgi:hypothetical protein
MYTKEEQNAVNEIKTILENYEKFQGKVSYLIEDSERKILFCNKSFCNMIGFDGEPENLIGYNCEKAAEDNKSLYINSEKFVEDINDIFKDKTKKQTHLIEMVNGKKYKRDYVPLFFQDNYIGHSWQYYEI